VRRGVRSSLAAAQDAHAPGRAPRPRAHGGRPVPRPVAVWHGGGRELAVFKLGSDGWWTEAGDGVSEDVLILSSRTAVAWLSARRRACLIRQG
jgi:hypothetical protein